MPKAPACSPTPATLDRQQLCLKGDWPASPVAGTFRANSCRVSATVFPTVYGQCFVILKDGLSPFNFYAYGLDLGSIPCSVVYSEE